MKLKRYLKWMLGAATLLSGCADDDFIDRSQVWDGTIPDELTLTLTIPDPEIVSLGGTRGENGPISTVTLMQYDANGKHLGNISFDEQDIKPVLNSSNPEWTLTATLDKNSKSIQVVANYTVAEADDDPSKLKTEKAYLLSYTDGEGAPYAGPVLWANVELKDLLADNSYAPEIALERQAAKLSVEVKDDANFTLTGFMVYGMAEKGCVAPTKANLAAGDPTIPDDVTGSYNTDWIEDPDKFGYFFETAAEDADKNPNARIILKGNYEGKEYYYVAAFRSRTPEVKDKPTETPGAYSYKGIPALRNHWYKLSVEKVRGAGWNSEEEAQTAMPDNRATIELTDMTESISDMIATRDYMLGVSGDVTTDWETPATVTVVTSYASSINAAAQQKLPVKFSTETSWIQLTEAQQEGIVIGNNTRDFEIALAPNSLSTDDRTGEITVTLGKLTRTIKVTQTGRPLRRERHAIVVGLPGVTATEAGGIRYYEWIDGSNATETAPQGMKDSENRGENRNDALIFTAVPAYELYYKIPVESGDTYKLSSEADFTVKEEGGYYIIKANTTDKPNIAKAELTITNKDGAEIKYDLLQVGYFHKLDGQHQAAACQKSGWFYYEVVHFRGGYPGGMYVLDRNLGASTNASYDPTSISYTAEDDAAIGGYFKVNTGRPAEADRKGLYDHKTITDKIGMTYAGGRFIVMSENELKGMGLPSNKNFGAGAISLPFDEGEVAGGNVYIPAAGYYYGTTYRNASHVNLWTRTLLGGTQGLTESDDEYGVNYRILDIFGGRVNYSGLRMGSGSGLTVKENLMRYLPLRLIWRGEGESMDASDVADSDGTIGTGENVTIYVKNSAGWGNMNLHAWISKDNYMSSYPGTAMQKVTHNGESNWYKLEIDTQWTSLLFNNGNDKTGDIVDYRNGHNDATEFEFEVKSSKTENCNNYDFLGTGGSGGDTPTERTAITIMLLNDGEWGMDNTNMNAGIVVYNSSESQIGKYSFSDNNKVTYQNQNWFKWELYKSSSPNEIEALNNGGSIGLYINTSTYSKFYQISEYPSDGAFFYTNKGSNGEFISKQVSATVNTTPGWISSDNAKYRIYWKYNSQSFVGLNVFIGSSESIVNTLYNNWPNEERGANYSFNQYSANKEYAYVEFSHSKFGSNTSLTAEPRLSGTNNYGGESRKTTFKVSDCVLVDGVYCYTISGEGGSGGSGGVPSGSGSGSTGGDDSSLPAIPSGKARVVVYNDEGWSTGGRMEIMYQYGDNQTDKFDMTEMSVNGSSLYYADVNPGMYQFKLNRENPSWQWANNDTYFQTSNITAGNTYYFTVSSSGALSTSTKKYAPRRAVRRK